VIVSVLPKQLEIESNPFDGISDDELAALLAAVRKTLGIAEERKNGKDETGH